MCRDYRMGGRRHVVCLAVVLCLLPATVALWPTPTSLRHTPRARGGVLEPRMKQSSRKGKRRVPSSGKGFGSAAAAPSSPPPSAQKRSSKAAADARAVEIDLGRGKSVAIMLPLLDDDPDDAAVEGLSNAELQARFGHLTGAGDIVWPAGLALTRMLAHCPSFVAEKTVLELGCGLGAVGLTAATAGAKSVVLADYDADVLALAKAGAALNGVDGKVATTRLDWSLAAVPKPEGGPFDVIVGADILYDRSNAVNIARLLPQLLATVDARCMIADQTQWPWRAEFEAVCAKGGLAVAQIPLPGAEDVQLLSIQRAMPTEGPSPWEG